MASSTMQLGELFNFTWFRKHFPAGKITSANTESSSQSSPCQSSSPKVVTSVGSHGSSPGILNGRTELGTFHKEDFQHHQTSDMTRDNLKPGLKETKEKAKPRLQKRQYPILLCPTNLQSLEPPLPPPPSPNKPLPKIPTEARPHTAPDQVGQKMRDRQVPAWNPPYTGRKARANYSPFPELVVVPPRDLSLSLQFYQKTHPPQQSPCPNTTTTKQLARHVAELYHDPTKGSEKSLKELRDVPIEELLPRVIGSLPVQESSTWPWGREFIRPIDGVIISSEVEVAHSSGSHSGLAIVSPQLEYSCDKTTPIVSRQSPPKALRPEASSGNSAKATFPIYPNSTAAPEAAPKADDHHDRRPKMESQEPCSNRTIRGRRPIGASLGFGTQISSLESRRRRTLEVKPKITLYERPVSVVLTPSRSATHLPMHEPESCPMFTKKSAPNLRRAVTYEPPQLPQPLRPLEPTQPPWVNAPMCSAFDSSDDEENHSRFNFLRTYRRRSREARESSKNNSLRLKWRRSKDDSAPSSPCK